MGTVLDQFSNCTFYCTHSRPIMSATAHKRWTLPSETWPPLGGPNNRRQADGYRQSSFRDQSARGRLTRRTCRSINNGARTAEGQMAHASAMGWMHDPSKIRTGLREARVRVDRSSVRDRTFRCWATGARQPGFRCRTRWRIPDDEDLRRLRSGQDSWPRLHQYRPLRLCRVGSVRGLVL